MSSPARDLLELLMRRSSVIESLRDTPLEKPEITDQLAISRQTVDRSLRELESAALVERTTEGYCLTAVGDLAICEFDALLDRYDQLCSARDLLSFLPPDVPLDLGPFTEADVIYADHPLPHEPLRAFEQLIENAGTIVGYSPVSFPQYVSIFHREITHSDTEIELYFDAPLIEWLRQEYDTELREALSVSTFSLYQLPEPFCPNMGIAIFDASLVWIGIYDDSGNIRGTITTETDAAVTWASDRLETCRASSQEVFLRSLE